jgi:Cu/Ag efflux pump CusA
MLKHPSAIGLATAGILAAALTVLVVKHLAAPALPRDQAFPVEALPDEGAPGGGLPAGVAVLTGRPGMPAPAVEQTLTNRVERALAQAPGVLRTESRSIAGVSVVRVTFRAG